VAADLGLPSETLRKYVRQVEANEGRRAEMLMGEEREEIRKLRHEVFELRRANEILKAASVFPLISSTRTGRGERVHLAGAWALRGRADLHGPGRVGDVCQSIDRPIIQRECRRERRSSRPSLPCVGCSVMSVSRNCSAPDGGSCESTLTSFLRCSSIWQIHPRGSDA
jgi:hypothetical protein